MLIIEHPQDRRARRTQDAIIAAVSLILEKGADALTIRDITERGRITTVEPSIYIFPANRSCCSSFWMISCREWGELMQNHTHSLKKWT